MSVYVTLHFTSHPAASANNVTLSCPFEKYRGCERLGTVSVPDMSSQNKDPKIALQKLAGWIMEEQEEHFEDYHKIEMDDSRGNYHNHNEMEIDHDVREIDDEEEEFINTEPTLLPTLKKQLDQVNSCKGGYSALPPFVIDQLACYGKELKLSLSNEMIISVKNGASFVATTEPRN